MPNYSVVVGAVKAGHRVDHYKTPQVVDKNQVSAVDACIDIKKHRTTFALHGCDYHTLK